MSDLAASRLDRAPGLAGQVLGCPASELAEEIRLEEARGPAKYEKTCPTCGHRTIIDERMTVISRCRHFLRVWRLSPDPRLHIEFRTPEMSR